MRIRWRLTWYSIGFTALSLLVIILAIVVLVQGSAGQDQDVALSNAADETSASLASEAVRFDGSAPAIVPDATGSDQVFLAVYDESGAALYWSGTVDGAVPDLPAAVIVEALDTGASVADVGSVRVQVRSWTDPAGTTGVVAAYQSLDVVEEQLLGLRWFLGVFGFIALVAAAIGSWFMAGRALRPLNLLARTTDEIGETGDLTQRLPSVRQDDEVGVLTDSFNTMLASLEAARADRDRTIAAQQRFVADASHELRSPLTSIRSNAGFLVEQPGASADDRRDATEDIAHEAERMSGLIDRLLTLARSDVGASLPPEGLVDLAHVAQLVGRRARNLPLDLVIDASSAVVVRGDDAELAEVIWILVDNAQRHGARHATVSVFDEGTSAVVRVDDDGPGIDPELAELVFDRFYRGDPARSGSGHGLGLSIARTTLEHHGGSITVSESPTGGARFQVRMPAAGSG